MWRLPLATDWPQVLVPPIWSAFLLVLVLVAAFLFRRPLSSLLASLGVSRLSILGVDVDWITDQAKDAYAARGLDAPDFAELRATAMLSVRLAPLIRERRILWVDDVPAGVEAETRLLRRFEIDVVNATTTEAALERLHLEPGRIDLVISDWTRNGDGEAGPKLLAALRDEGYERPVLLYVEHDTPERRARAAELGARALTAEPDELLKQVLVELATAS